MKNKFQDLQAIPLNTQGFEDLSLQQQILIYHLTMAGAVGAKITLKQMSPFNSPVIDLMINAYRASTHSVTSTKVKNEIKNALFMLFIHSGIYHHMSGEKIKLPLSQDSLDFIKVNTLPKDFAHFEMAFSDQAPVFLTVQNSTSDVVLESGVAFYPPNTTTEEIQKYIQEEAKQLTSEEEKRSPFGFNRLIKRDQHGNLQSLFISAKKDNPFSGECHRIIYHLKQALPFSENEQQLKSIQSLIHFYETGNSVDFDNHCVDWVKDQNSHVYFINGMIESYDDPLGIGCSFESLVAFKNPHDVERVDSIIKNIQWFEDHLPIDPRFKKEKAKGLSASSVNVISMSGRTSPALPLGINLPNNDWIRNKHGSKSVTLSNVANSRTEIESPLLKEMHLEQYHEILQKHDHINKNLHIDLHEIAGHGSAQLLAGVSQEDLSSYYSIIEECRADLVALYYAGEQQLEEFGIYPKGKTDEIALSLYVSYLTNGLLGQLRRVKLGNDLTQAHLRNRQIIASWVLSHIKEEHALLMKQGGKSYIKINDVNAVRQKIGELLAIIQRIKSEGDFKTAKYIVETYGTKVNPELHSEVLERVSSLELPNITAYIAPVMRLNDHGIPELVIMDDFVEQQILLWSMM